MQWVSVQVVDLVCCWLLGVVANPHATTYCIILKVAMLYFPEGGIQTMHVYNIGTHAEVVYAMHTSGMLIYAKLT